MNVFDLSAKISLDTAPYIRSLMTASNQTNTMGGLIAGGIGKATKVMIGALAAASTALVAFGTSSINVGMQFDKSMSQVAATMGMSVDEMMEEIGHASTSFGEFEGNLRDFAQFMGRNTAFTASEAADALNYMALAGYSVQESMEMLPNVLSLAAAGNFDLARASDMVTDTQTAFGISAERTTKMVDEMAKAASTGNTSVEQLGDAFLVVGGLAKNLNGGFVQLADGTYAEVDGIQELEIALTAMANAGVKGGEAGTHMRNMLLKLASPTEEGTKQLEALGVAVFDAGGQMRSLKDIFSDLSVSFENLTQEEKMQAISNLFNTRDMASAEALLSAIESDWDEIGAEILQAEGAASQMAETQLDNLAGDVTLFKSALEGAQITISDVLTPTLREFVQLGTSGLQELTTAFEEEGLSGAIGVFGDILSGLVSKIIEVLPQIIDGGAKLIDAFITGILDNIDMVINAGVDIMNTIMNSFVTSLPKIIKAGGKVILGLVKGIGQALPTLIPAIVDMVLEIVETLLGNIDLIIDAALQLMNGLAMGLVNAIPVLIEHIPTIIEALIDGILGAIPMIIEAGIQLLTALVGALPEIIVAIVESLPEIINGIISGLMDNLPMLIKAGIDLFVALVGNIPQIIIEIVKRLPEIIIGIVQGLISNIGMIIKAGVDLMVGLGQGIASFASEIWKKAKEIGQNIIDAIKGFFSNMWEQGKNLVVGLWNGINDKIQWIKDKIAGWVDNVLGWFKKLFGIESPSKVMAGFGDMLDQGLAKGIMDNIDGVLDAATEIHDGVNEALEGMGGTVNTNFGSIDSFGLSANASGIRTPMEEAMFSLSERMDNLEEIMYNAVNRALSDGFDLRFNDRELTRVVREHA